MCRPNTPAAKAPKKPPATRGMQASSGFCNNIGAVVCAMCCWPSMPTTRPKRCCSPCRVGRACLAWRPCQHSARAATFICTGLGWPCPVRWCGHGCKPRAKRGAKTPPTKIPAIPATVFAPNCCPCGTSCSPVFAKRWRAASHAAQAHALLEEVAAQDLALVGQPPRLVVLQPLSPARQANVLRHWLKGLGVRASQAQLQALMQQVQACTTRGHRIHIKVGEGFVHRVEDRIDWYNP